MKGGEGTIVVVTDLQQAGWDANDEGGVPDGIGITVPEIASPVGNVAVMSARRDGAGIVAAIHNFASTGDAGAVQLRVDDKEVARQMVDIAPEAAADVRFIAMLPLRDGRRNPRRRSRWLPRRQLALFRARSAAGRADLGHDRSAAWLVDRGTLH